MSQQKNNHPIEPLLMDLEEAAIFLGIPKSTLHTWAWSGKVPCVRLGRRRMFRKQDIIEWVERHVCPASAPHLTSQAGFCTFHEKIR